MSGPTNAADSALHRSAALAFTLSVLASPSAALAQRRHSSGAAPGPQVARMVVLPAIVVAAEEPPVVETIHAASAAVVGDVRRLEETQSASDSTPQAPRMQLIASYDGTPTTVQVRVTSTMGILRAYDEAPPVVTEAEVAVDCVVEAPVRNRGDALILATIRVSGRTTAQ